MGPIWGRQDPGGPHVGPMNFVIWDALIMHPMLGVFIVSSKSELSSTLVTASFYNGSCYNSHNYLMDDHLTV